MRNAARSVFAPAQGCPCPVHLICDRMGELLSDDKLDSLSLHTIMTRWPATVHVFIGWRLHCVGCPIADFHRLADAAREHGYEPAALRGAVRLAIEVPGVSPAAPPRPRPRSAAGGAGP